MTITSMLARVAAARPGSVFLRTVEGDLTYGQTQQSVRTVADNLARAGIGPGSAVVLIMRNSADQVVVWFALARLGARHVPLNTALVGRPLEHALRIAAPVMVIADFDLLQPIAATVAAAAPDAVTLVRGAPDGDAAARFEDLTATGPPGTPPFSAAELDVATLLFSSGTTGPSKACELSHRYLA